MRRNRILWGGTLGFALFILGVGLWLEYQVTTTLRSGLREDLTTLRNSNVAALEGWMKSQQGAARLATEEEGVRATAQELILAARAAKSDSDLAEHPAQEKLKEQISSTLDSWGFEGFLLIADGRIISSTNPNFFGQMVDHKDDERLLRAADEGGAIVSRPRPLRADESAPHVMWAASALRDSSGVNGSLAFQIDPSKEFTEILQTAQFGQSGETYAFDAKGALLSASRFEKDLAKWGLIEEGQNPLFNLSILDPATDLTSGGKLPPNKNLLDFTAAAKSAISGESSVNVTGYRDYRGVEVVGAWTWFERHGFGVVTELDYDEAYGSVRIISRATHTLFGVLVIAALIILLGGGMFGRLQLRAQRLGQYTLEGKIGEGGMGSVYRAKHALLRRPTAIKMIKSKDIDDRTRERFEREVQTTAQLSHPNTIAIYDYGHTDTGVFYYAMEYLIGCTLQQLVRSSGPIPQARVLHILKQALGSLSEAHDQGLVHRDIKPANIMLCHRGGVPDTVKVLDFGLVKNLGAHDGKTNLTATNALTGTPHYMSPEAIVDSSQVDHRSDIYAIGAVAYYLLTAQQVFDAPNMMAVLTRHITDPPERPSIAGKVEVDPEFEELVLSCLAKEAKDRPQSADALLRKLESLSENPDLHWGYAEANAWWQEHDEFRRDRDFGSVADRPTLAIAMSNRITRPVEPTISLDSENPKRLKVSQASQRKG